MNRNDKHAFTYIFCSCRQGIPFKSKAYQAHLKQVKPEDKSRHEVIKRYTLCMCGKEDFVLPQTPTDEESKLFYQRHRDCPKRNVRSQVARRLFSDLEVINYQQRRAEKGRLALAVAEKELEDEAGPNVDLDEEEGRNVVVLDDDEESEEETDEEETDSETERATAGIVRDMAMEKEKDVEAVHDWFGDVLCTLTRKDSDETIVVNAAEERHVVDIDELTAEVLDELSAEREVLSAASEVAVPVVNEPVPVVNEPVTSEVCLRQAPTTLTAFVSVKDQLSREKRWLNVERERADRATAKCEALLKINEELERKVAVAEETLESAKKVNDAVIAVNEERMREVMRREREVEEKEKELARREKELVSREKELASREKALEARENGAEEKERLLLAKENAVDEREKIVNERDEQLKLFASDVLKDKQKLRDDKKQFREDRKNADEEVKKVKERMAEEAVKKAKERMAEEEVRGLFHIPIKDGKLFCDPLLIRDVKSQPDSPCFRSSDITCVHLNMRYSGVLRDFTYKNKVKQGRPTISHNKRADESGESDDDFVSKRRRM